MPRDLQEEKMEVKQKTRKCMGFQVKERCLSLFIVSYDMGVDKMMKDNEGETESFFSYLG